MFGYEQSLKILVTNKRVVQSHNTESAQVVNAHEWTGVVFLELLKYLIPMVVMLRWLPHS